MKLLIASDAWHPQVNGVVRSLEQMVRRAPEHGFATTMLTAADFPSLPMPGYPEIRLALRRFFRRQLDRKPLIIPMVIKLPGRCCE